MTIKVLNVIDSLYAGGAESLLKNFLIETKKYNEYQIDGCTLYKRNIFSEELRKHNITVFDLGLRFKYNLLGVFKLIGIIRKGHYEIVHVHLFPADVFVAIASLFLPRRIKFIFSEHNVYNRRRSIKLYKPIDKFVYSRYRRIVCVSEGVKSELNKYLPSTSSKSIVIKNAIPIPDVMTKSAKEYDIVFVGRLEDAKGVDILIKAVSVLRDRYKLHLKVALVGDGSKRVYLENLVNSFNLKDELIFLGVQKDISRLMNKSKIFVLPSRWEGLPMVILEAMANMMPIITTPVGGIPEVIEDGVSGIFAKPDNPEDLASKISEVISDKNTQERISKNAFEKVKREYSIEVYKEKMLKFYREILNED